MTPTDRIVDRILRLGEEPSPYRNYRCNGCGEVQNGSEGRFGLLVSYGEYECRTCAFPCQQEGCNEYSAPGSESCYCINHTVESALAECARFATLEAPDKWDMEEWRFEISQIAEMMQFVRLGNDLIEKVWKQEGRFQ